MASFAVCDLFSLRTFHWFEMGQRELPLGVVCIQSRGIQPKVGSMGQLSNVLHQIVGMMCVSDALKACFVQVYRWSSHRRSLDFGPRRW